MNARVYRAVLGGVFLKARSRHDRAKEKILGESGGTQRAAMCQEGIMKLGYLSLFKFKVCWYSQFLRF